MYGVLGWSAFRETDSPLRGGRKLEGITFMTQARPDPYDEAETSSGNYARHTVLSHPRISIPTQSWSVPAGAADSKDGLIGTQRQQRLDEMRCRACIGLE